MEGLRKLHRCDVNAENRKRENTMDTKTIIVTIVCAVLGSSALTAVVRTNNRFCLVSTNGGVDYDDASYARGVAFGFCF